ncbi:MAG: BatD family protein [Planctomycetota bacterium]|nr:BatD family protein [Planctomycetota bacterium]
MHSTYLAPILLLALPLGAQVKPIDSPRAFLEVTASTQRPYFHQVIRVRLRFGVEQTFARDHLIQLFRIRLDLPVQIDAAFLDQLEGTRRLEPVAPAALAVTPGKTPTTMRIAVNQAAEIARRLPDEQRDGQTYTVLQIERQYVPERVGSLTLPAASLRFAHATGFRNDALRGRVPIDPRDVQIRSSAASLEVRALPTTNRPAAFSGAVGRFRIQTEAHPRTLTAGEQLQLTLRLEGEGNFGGFALPSPGDDPGLHVLGRVERQTPTSRVLVFDIEPAAGVRAIPAIAFSYFEPGSGRYQTIESARIPLTVRGTAPGTDRPAAGKPGIDDIYALKASPDRVLHTSNLGAPGLFLLILLSSLPWLFSVGLRSMLHQRARAADPIRRRALAAHRVFLQDIEADASRLGDSLVAYLAGRMNCTPAAVISHQLREQLVAAGVGEQLAQTTQAHIEQLFADRYTGSQPTSHDGGAPSATEIRALVESLEFAFRRSI